MSRGTSVRPENDLLNISFWVTSFRAQTEDSILTVSITNTATRTKDQRVKNFNRWLVSRLTIPTSHYHSPLMSTSHAPFHPKITSFTSFGKIPKKSHEATPIPSIRYLYKSPIISIMRKVTGNELRLAAFTHFQIVNFFTLNFTCLFQICLKTHWSELITNC